MPDWSPFEATVLRAAPRARLLAAIQRAEGWLDVPGGGDADFRGVAATVDGAAPAYRALLLVEARLRRELGLGFDDESAATFIARVAACDEAERAPAGAPAVDADACRTLRRLLRATDLTAALRRAQPGVVVADASPEAQAAHDALLALGARADAAVRACGLGLATPGRLAALEAVLGDYDALAPRFGADDPFRANLDHSRGHVAIALAGGAAFLGRVPAALAWYDRAAAAFDAAAEPGRAGECRTAADALRARAGADLDADAARALAAVVAGNTDPLARAADLAALARQQSAAGDNFEAARTADQAAAALAAAGVGDPDEVGIDAAAASLFATADASTSAGGDTAFVRRCTGVVETWSILALVRAAARPDPAGRARATATLAAAAAFGTALVARWNAVAAAIDEALAPYQLGGAHAETDAAARATARWQDNVVAIDARAVDALGAFEDLPDDAPPDALADTALELEAAAAALAGAPALTRARCRLLTAAVRLRAGDAAACRAALDEATAMLLRGGPPVPESFRDAGERQTYLDIQWRRLAAAGMGDPQAALAACHAAVDFVERLRAHVGDPYQQSAFLKSAKWAYDYGVGTARWVGDWDAMLGIMDLAKAQGVLRRPPSNDGPPGEPRPDAALDAVRALDADPDPVRRMRRWSQHAVARAAAAPAPRPPTLAAVQGALAGDEVVLAYYWLQPTVLLVAAIDAEGIGVARVTLDDGMAERLQQYTTLLAAEQTNTGFGKFFRALGALLVPDVCRARMRGKRRLVVSPHRALHLVPFHAIDWDGSPLVEQFATRYVPNLGSLLLPWTGPRARGPGGGPVLSVGCGAFDGADSPPPLGDAEPEALDAAAAYAAAGRPTTVVLGPDATRAGLRALAPALPGYSVVHFATHARAVLAPDAADNPLATRVHLRDGPVDGISIAAWGLRAELAVLAACNSGQRAIAGRGLTELPGDDVFGLQAVLFGSGVRCVLGALWPVTSEPARPIMRRVHAELARGEPPDLALQTAVREHRAGPAHWRDAIYWAPYYLVEVGRPDVGPAAAVAPTPAEDAP